MFIAAVLTPKGAKHPQFNRVGFPVQPFNDHLVLGLAEGNFVKDFFGYGHLHLIV
jgi:hypothetical protein